MQTLTLLDLVQHEGILDHRQIFIFRREDGKSIIEFDLPPVKEVEPPMSAAQALKRLQALQFNTGCPTNSVKIIRVLRRDRYHCRAKSRSMKN